DPKPADQQRVIEAGLNGMLKASGWDYACVLSQAQADEMKKMSQARETPAAERGVLGLKLDGWPVVEAIPNAPAAKAGVRNGDVVVGVNGEDIARVKTAADAVKILQGPPGGIVKLTVKREGKTLGFEVTRASIATSAVEAREVEPGVLLIKISTFEGSGIAATVNRFIHTRPTNQESVVILDLRDNPGGRPEEANGVADIFLDSKLLEICQFRDGTRIAFKSNPGAVGTRVILLTNKGTASGAEMLAMALHDYSRAIIVGEKTCGALFGKDIEELSGGQTIVFRMEPTVLSPSGHDYSLTGIPPDVKVSDSQSKEKDEILVRALALARGERSKQQ
ncbi:MAG TPA: S41 family peptidase, partial [Verrucomicrobiae bacterium]|nr:S41 family peptidase [Verrucomicrobiae bacterium]